MADDILARAVDTAAATRVLARHLQDGASILDCRVARYRRRPGERCITQYLVRVRDAGDEVDEHRVIAQWYDDTQRAATVFRRLSKHGPVTVDEWRAPFAPVFFDGATGMLATTYPWDRRMPSLPRAARGTEQVIVAPMLASLGAVSSRPLRCDVETARYREHLSAVLRYTVTADVGGARFATARFFVKLYVDESGARVARALAALAHATGLDPGAAQVCPAVAYVPECRALVVREAPGAPLDAWLRPSLDRSDIEAALARAASSLRRFGGLPPVGGLPGAERTTATRLARAAAAVVSALPETADVMEELARTAELASAPGVEGIVHGDVKLEHMFLADQQVTLIDTDSAHVGDPRWDAALLGARWWTAVDAGPDPDGRRDWGCRVIDEAYFREAPEGWRHRFQALRAVAFVDVAAGLVKRQEPQWARRAGRAVAEAVRVSRSQS